VTPGGRDCFLGRIAADETSSKNHAKGHRRERPVLSDVLLHDDKCSSRSCKIPSTKSIFFWAIYWVAVEAVVEAVVELVDPWYSKN